MTNFASLSQKLIDVAASTDKLRPAYATYVESLLETPLWSPDSQGGLRIPWNVAADARKDPQLNSDFESPGLYLFGGGKAPGWPLYLGMTTGSLYKRLARRYVRGAKSQCQLAVDYGDALLQGGIGGFPPEVVEWYRKNYPGNCRLEGAVTFARCRIESVWFTLLPIADSAAVRGIEARLIRVANEWNRQSGHPLLLNTQDV